MTPENQRIAIAEACGWRKGSITILAPIPGNDCTAVGCPPKPGSPSVPDYLNDLNAMHEAEKILTKLQRQCYVAQLDSIHLDIGWSWAKQWSSVTATAAQRAEAFLRTLNLWEE